MSKKFLAVLAATAALAATANAGSIVQEKLVTYAELDLSRPAGAKLLVMRLQRAAEAVCGADADERGLWRKQAREACVKDAVERALADLDEPMVETVYRNGDAVREIASNAQ
ncbi:MAG: UrcA family protein [Parvularculaceae bacterium]